MPRARLCRTFRADRCTPGGTARKPEIRPAAAGRARHRCAEQLERRARRGDRRRKDCGRRHQAESRGRGQDGRRVWTVRDAWTHRHPCAHLRRHRRAAVLCWRQQCLPGRIHAARRRDHGRGRRMRRLAELRGLQTASHRSLEDPHPRLSQHRRQRHARRNVRAGSRRHGGEAHRRHGAPLPRAHRRHQDRALRRTRVGAGRTRGRSRNAGGRAGDGRLRREQARTTAGRAGDEEAAPGRHLHPCLFGTARRTGRRPGTSTRR